MAVLADFARVGEAAALGGRLLTSCQRPATVNAIVVRSRLSVGLAVSPGHGRSAAALLACADRADGAARRRTA